jgi:hypothetical protein
VCQCSLRTQFGGWTSPAIKQFNDQGPCFSVDVNWVQFFFFFLVHGAPARTLVPSLTRGQYPDSIDYPFTVNRTITPFAFNRTITN